MQPTPDSPTPKSPDLRARESHLRANLQKLLSSVIVLIASCMLLLSVPFFPATVSILGAVGLAALAFKAPSLAIGTMLLASLPGYVYQLGLPVSVFVGMAVFCFILFPFGNSPGSAMGMAAGAIAAMLMLTPFYFFSLPVLIGVTLFRARGQKVGSTGSLLVFLLLFLPLLTANLSISSYQASLPLFEQVNYQMKEPLSAVEVGNMVSVLVKEAGTNSVIAKNLTAYLPVGYTEYGSRLLAIILVSLLAVSTSIAFGGLSLFNWLLKREIGTRYLPLIAPVASLLAASVAFLLLLDTLKTSFGYYVGLDASGMAGMVLGTALVGGIGSASELWLRHRDLVIRLKEELTELLPSTTQKNDDLKARLEATRAQCSKLDLDSEQALVDKCNQELSFVSSLEYMDVTTLQRKLKLFEDIEDQLHKAAQESMRKLARYYMEGRLRYNDYIRQSNEFGFAAGETIPDKPMDEVASSGYKAVLKEQENLNGKLSRLAQLLMERCDSIFRIVVTEIDSTVMTGGVEISRNYLYQGKSEDAVETMLMVLVAVERNMQVPTTNFSNQISAASSGLKTVLSDTMLPMLDVMGDEQGISHLNSIISQLDGSYSASTDEKTFARLSRVVDQGKRLAELSHLAISWVATKIAELEKEIEGRVPKGYNWGKEPNALLETEDLISQLEGRSGKQDLETRVAAIEKTKKAVKSKALIINQYASTLEFLINYINIEYLLDRILQEKNHAQDNDLPVRSTFALRYLKLYSEKHYSEVILDQNTNIVRVRREDEQ